MRYITEIDDTLSDLAARYNCSTATIIQASRLNKHELSPGLLLTIPLDHPHHHFYHTVRPFEGLDEIAARYHTKVGRIKKDNLVDTTEPGDILFIHEVKVRLFYVCSDSLCIKEEIKKIDYPVDDIKRVALRELFFKLSEFAGRDIFLRDFILNRDTAIIDIGSLAAAPGTGSAIEEMMVESILKTLSAYKEIVFADLLLDGCRAETISGHMLLGCPLPVRNYGDSAPVQE